jgi:hypothetical protein
MISVQQLENSNPIVVSSGLESHLTAFTQALNGLCATELRSGANEMGRN